MARYWSNSNRRWSVGTFVYDGNVTVSQFNHAESLRDFSYSLEGTRGQSLSIIQDSIGGSARVEKILGVFRNSVLRRGVEKRLPRIMTWCQWLLAKLPILNHKKEDDEPWDCET
ncbi:hypothetical protein CISG_05968 [Coccidioides immitis RMSCC 3703]|uniref:Uncharacterized protein n=1 Tax=Coccidioides immitis RMSCC 3703 TaxID=454286 RepID=A0A0J8QWU9_COCIT|nr:hypothetical protein CISG_05968 [Coccidioides immitis RMSCC 3703]